MFHCGGVGWCCLLCFVYCVCLIVVFIMCVCVGDVFVVCMDIANSHGRNGCDYCVFFMVFVYVIISCDYYV